MSNKFVSTDPMDTLKTMESTGDKSPDVVEIPSVEIPVASHSPEVAPIEELAQQRTSPTFTAQDLKSEENFIEDTSGFYGVPGQVSDIAQILFEKSAGVIGEGYGANNN